MVVDEEQRFGVEHKEHITALRAHVDMLTMSATPIPRTLEMSLAGIREMSTITTPPEERHPILTYVGAYDEKLVAAAIRRELLREGQVFYVHNRVADIESVARRMREAVPEARIAVAHGQMNEDRLEKIIDGFWAREWDVLLCTTIVETGLDISNANTLIVDHAEVLGLSQMHQLRGRVGRGRERGYAYFLYPGEKPLTETAHDRLATIAQNSDLGCRDGGGDEGPGDPGRRVDPGRRAERAHRRRRVRPVHSAGRGGGDGVQEGGRGRPAASRPRTEPAEVRVDLPIDANIPHDYIPAERLRLDAYRRIAGVAVGGGRRGGPGRVDRPVRADPGAGGEPAGGGRRSGSCAARSGSPRWPWDRRGCGSRRWCCPSRGRCGSPGCIRGRSTGPTRRC